MSVFAEKSEKNALVSTIVVHGILLLLFLLFGLKYMDPPPIEFTMGADFGFADDGSGKIEDQPISSSVNNTPQPPEPTQESAPAVMEDVQTQDAEDAPAVKPDPKPKEKPVEKPEKKPEKKPDPQPSNDLKDRLNIIKNRQTGTGNNSEGDTHGDGNKGNPNGTEGNHSPGPGGQGYSIEGHPRTLGHKATPSQDCPIGAGEETIVMKIFVNRAGKVVRATQVLKSSTTTDACLVRSALEACLKSNWNADPSAPIEQVGYFSFEFNPR
ncbi:MAG: hypothetical protein KDD36_06110 [Flavobacteriales bacterium]|nr:hypothetical protein [Flavobacteriales bacterium]